MPFLLTLFYSDANLVLVEAPLLAPIEVAITEDHKKAIELETAQAAEMALSEGDDEEF